MKWVILTGVCLVILFFVVAFIVDGKREERIAIYMNHLEGVSNVPYKEGISVRVCVKEKQMEMEYKKEKIYLPFRQLVSVNIIPWEKAIIREASPLAAGIVGGLIGGDAMAVVGAIDAKGRTWEEKEKFPYALEIQYYPKGDYQNIKRLVFGDVASQGMILQFAQTLCKSANLPEPQYIAPQPNGPTYL